MKHGMRQKAKKEKVTLSLNHDLVAALDRMVEQSHLSRSRLVESVLQQWYEEDGVYLTVVESSLAAEWNSEEDSQAYHDL